MNLEIANKTNTDLKNKLNELDKKQQGSSF